MADETITGLLNNSSTGEDITVERVKQAIEYFQSKVGYNILESTEFIGKCADAEDGVPHGAPYKLRITREHVENYTWYVDGRAFPKAKSNTRNKTGGFALYAGKAYGLLNCRVTENILLQKKKELQTFCIDAGIERHPLSVCPEFRVKRKDYGYLIPYEAAEEFVLRMEAEKKAEREEKDSSSLSVSPSDKEQQVLNTKGEGRAAQINTAAAPLARKALNRAQMQFLKKEQNQPEKQQFYK